MRHYHVIDGETGRAKCHTTPGWALHQWHRMLTRALQAVKDDATFLEIDTRRNLTTEADLECTGRVEETVNGVTYVVEATDACDRTLEHI
ncbi:hypothetical protein [Micromonospora maritima]|uniref:hypothetical protein n=1 Tax=Micromonospora maritima TaxID=986711 RepID=UPI00157C7D69|nr:hypothetical protein [Micromonospora maritima]